MILTSGCGLFQTEVIRDVRAVYAEDGESLLIVQSRYDTSKPSNPHFSDPRGRNWRLYLYEAANASDPAGARTLLASFPEGIQYDSIIEQGGGAQYAMVFWNKARRFVVFSGQLPFIYRLGDGSAQPLEIGAARLAQAMESHPRLDEASRPDYLSADFLASILSPVAATPSPDGSLIALQYFSVLQEGENFFDPFSHYRLVLFLSSDDLEVLGSSWVSGNRWHLETMLDPWELAGQDESIAFSNLAWLPDSSGVIYYLGPGDSPEGMEAPKAAAAFIEAPASPVSTNLPATLVYLDGSIECQGCATGAPAPSMFYVPQRPVPGSGGPVNREGNRAVLLSYPEGEPGNITRLESRSYDWQGTGLAPHESGDPAGPPEELLLPADHWFQWLDSPEAGNGRFNYGL